ncbi:cell surface protein SprA [Chryseobacterium indologenes]|uniref:T9SS outer membrane translocon Sov/SprA n=1 Tax=Chryseobacterium indologenes TaxID=253 RepID=UPI000F50BEC3|nr:cell surface protein SprA [Chryseobacterium indologenes]AYZ37216.1 cell surface protein SprA [Chryseobacterium indologenes]MBF6646071.1 cell surface protein SprA [Chryseobacterium indologenes]MBU3048519.1 cell surface protein SprA [Chryseobacterium indologenes]MEB4762577.1 cell surface protein SprA [Chryseobacterium indologenes]QQQ70253.1 cell surface protein SprA [Chryseobacterium indologenes]
MVANNKHFNIFLFLSFLCISVGAFAQQKQTDTLIIRKQYEVADPTRYEAYYDIKTGMYYVYPKVGNTITGPPTAMSPEEYKEYMLATQTKAYYKEKSEKYNLLFRKDKSDARKKGLIPSLLINNKLFETIFGGNKIEIIPSGYASIDFAGLYQKIDNPLILPQNRTSFTFDIDQRIQLGLLGKVGENLQLKANYDTQSGFAFENRMNLVWQSKGSWKDLQKKGLGNLDKPSEGGEDKIIKRVEFGNVNMPLSTSLIRGSQSLFGVKAEFQLGKTFGTVVLSQQQGEARNIVVQGGGVMNNFKVNAIDYEENQHFFLGHYFLNTYDNALLNYPQINSIINITRMEVWVLDQGNSNLAYQKSIIGIRDLGEGAGGGTMPDNSLNGLYDDISTAVGTREAGKNYGTILQGKTFAGSTEPYQNDEHFIFNSKARKLNSNEFVFQPQLGYISLNQKLNDNQLLAVSYSYTVNGSNKVYKVGEFSEESPVLITKVLRVNNKVNTQSPMWKLMMKNVYSLDAGQVSPDGFILNVLYRDQKTGGKVNYLPDTSVKDLNLLKLFNWDRLNMNGDIQINKDGTNGDGVFDFVNGITIRPENGRVIFTKVQPFGDYMQNVLGSNDPKYVLHDLYDKIKQTPSQSSVPQWYTIEGRYKGVQGQGISLGAVNVPQGSVKVSANGVQLSEGVDYTVDYMLGTVTIINENVKQSGQAINISLENQLTFNTQRKRFLGLNLERRFNEHFILGGTVINYSESPLTQKVNFGQEAVNNTMAGINLMYNNQAPFLTRLTDKLPLIKTEAPSNINFKMEGAYLLPGLNKGTNNQSYIDDFEQTTSKISLKEPAAWSLASKPEKNTEPPFNTPPANDDITSGYGRGLLSWYTIDPRFWNIGGKSPAGITPQSVSNHASRRVQTSEIFNNRDFVAGEQTYTNTFDISYYPKERGPYNVNPGTEQAQSRWAGIMRPISVPNFVSSNIEYVEFWMMDPYADGKPLGDNAKLLLQLGNVSEDVLKDGKMLYENGLPTPATQSSTTTSNWGVQPKQPPILYAFSTEGDDRKKQDVGYDGLSSDQESMRFGNTFVNPVTNIVDPAVDDFVFYMSDKFTGNQASSLIERYKYFRNPDGNSEANSLNVSSQTPDAEDINRDYNLDQTENYNQYTVDLSQQKLALGQNNIVDVKTVKANFQNGQSADVKWFLFRIPVSGYDPDQGAAQPSVLNNVRFARLMLTGFEQTSTIRFASMDLVRSDWRKYPNKIAGVADTGTSEGTGEVLNKDFEIGSVNIEENAFNKPPYVLPPGIDRQVLSGNAGAQRQNEASLYMKTNQLESGEARGVFKNTTLDMRRYKKLKVFTHAHDPGNRDRNIGRIDPKTKFFIRFGNDATDNYYEYEASLKLTRTTETTPMEIWPMENEVDLEIQNFVDAKIRRDKNNSDKITQRILDNVFGGGDNAKKIYIKGRPSLGNVTTIVIGIRNGIARGEEYAESINRILWVNELRLSEIENDGGYAGNASLNFNMGDFATVNANASYTSVGFGNIDSKPAERTQSTQSAFSINTAINVDKLLPEKTGIKIPLNYSYSQTIEDPKYNPLDTDVEFSKAPNREQLKKVARTYTQQRSIGVVNMRKERVNQNKKPKFYDIENVSVTAVYNDDYFRDIYTKKNYRQYLKGYIDYNYTFKPWVVKPFNKMISDTAKSTKYLRWVKEFNFNPVPTRLSFRTEIDRNYNELEFRNVQAILNGDMISNFDAIRNRNFFFGWQYGLGFNFTKSLKLEINSATRTLNDNMDVNSMDSKSIFGNVFRAGRPVLYNHRVQLNYKLPFQYLPYLDFIDAEVGYGFTYNWNARSTALLSSPQGSLGSIGQNTNVIQATASADLPKFFGQFNYFKNINAKLQKRKQEMDSLNNVYTKQWEKNRYRYKKYKFKNKLSIPESAAFFLTSFKQLNVSYNETNGTVLPGLLSAPNWYGYGQTLGGPTIGFLLGSQADIRRLVMENGWVSDSKFMTDPYVRMSTKELKADLQMMPMNDLRVDFNVLHTYNSNFTQSGFNYRDSDTKIVNPDFTFANEMVTYSNSTMLLSTSFKDGQAVYQALRDNARTLSQQLGGTANIDNNGYAKGYSIANAYILIPAFRAAMEGKSVAPMGNPKKSGFPLPNWRITYSGLKNIPIISGQFSKFDILHGYTATYTATGIQRNIDYYNNPNGNYPAVDASGVVVKDGGDKINPYTFAQIGYVESFSPLIGIDVTMRNNMQFGIQYNRNRMMVLGLVNSTLTEDSNTEYVVRLGYIVRNFRLGTANIRGRGTRGKGSDLNIRGDIALRDSKTSIMNILLNDSQVTGGQRLMNIKLSADYNVSENLNLRVFYEQMTSKYKISTAFPLSTIRAGISATFTFGDSGGGF